MDNKYFLIIPLYFFSLLSVWAVQGDSSSVNTTHVWSFGDIYYGYDFLNPASQNRRSFIVSHHRHNEFNLNNGIIGISHNSGNWKANFALHTGTYVMRNYAAEPALMRNIYEANIEVYFQEGFGVQAGVFPSHIGFESALSIENPTLSRSLIAEGSPYYETGLHLFYNRHPNWDISVLALNGWQRIMDNNNSKALGTKIQYKPNDFFLFNSSTFIGRELPAQAQVTRIFHNFYLRATISPRLQTFAAFDYGRDIFRDISGFNYWLGSAFIVHYQLNEKWKIGLRRELFRDTNYVILPSDNDFFHISAASANIDHFISKNLVFRVEGKVFMVNGSMANMEYSVLSSLSYYLQSAVR